jgi:hypothetical protein
LETLSGCRVSEIASIYGCDETFDITRIRGRGGCRGVRAYVRAEPADVKQTDGGVAPG